MAQAKAIGHEKYDHIKIPCPVCKSRRYEKLIALNQFDAVCERCLYYFEKNGRVMKELTNARN